MKLEDVITELLDVGSAPHVARCIREGRIRRNSTSLALDTIFPGQPRTQQAAAALLKVWDSDLQDAGGATMGRIIECISELCSRDRNRETWSRLVWTGPASCGSFPRSSRQIVREILIGAQRQIWLSAYWIAGPSDGEGIVGDIVELLADAAARGVDVAMALDCRSRSSGETNFDVLRTLWPADATRPRLYTWADCSHELHLKLHAKALVADRADALVTSANLTMHALERNMELGVRLRGKLAQEIAAQFDSLVTSKVLAAVEF